ncbi:MAG: hypothetical protein J0L92_30750 [Deltaproteobacteria bacterium]|nr:hypothetical protein [Deltaproteobacteria bacterium]
MEYQLATHSPSVLARHVLEADRLVIIDASSGRRDEVAFSDIRALRLRQTLGAYVMVIERASGPAVMVRSRCVLPSGIDDRVADYSALARRLHEACRANGPATVFVGGSTAFFGLGWVLLTLSVVFSAILVWALSSGDAPPRGLFAIVPLALVAGAACVHQGRATPYDPSAPPARLLPH